MIFIPGIKLKGQKISRVFLVINKVYNLKKAKQIDNMLIVNSKEILREKNLTKLKVIIQNNDFKAKRYLQISAMLFDKKGNTIDVNRTYLDYIEKNAREEVFMT
jgi:hypothetical protein